MVDVRYPAHLAELRRLTPGESREGFVVSGPFAAGDVRMALSPGGRLVTGGAVPGGGALRLPAPVPARSPR